MEQHTAIGTGGGGARGQGGHLWHAATIDENIEELLEGKLCDLLPTKTG